MQNELYYPGVDIPLPVANLVSVNTVAGNPVQSGDAVVLNNIVGVATTSAGPLPNQTNYVASVTPSGYIAVRTKGVFLFSVTPANAVAIGAKIYIDPATGLLSDNAAKTLFGIALNPVNANTATVIAVKL